MKRKPKNKKIIFYSALAAFLILAAIVIANNRLKKENTLATKNSQVIETKASRSGNTSRVTFFHTRPSIGSLAIPEEWEGKYRVKEEGNTVIFYYIGQPDNITPIFSLTVYSETAWTGQKNNNQKLIKSQDGSVYVYDLNADSRPAGDKVKEFLEMQQDIEKIIESFKIFKL
jgi:hypothetical protein